MEALNQIRSNDWWNSLSNEEKTLKCIEYFSGRNHNTLTFREIEGIWVINSKPMPKDPKIEENSFFCIYCGFNHDHTTKEHDQNELIQENLDFM